MNKVRDVIDKDHFDKVDKEDGEGEREGRVVEAVNVLSLPPLVDVHWAQEDGNAAHEDLMKKMFQRVFRQFGFGTIKKSILDFLKSVQN